ncbi:MAG: hypothetical protein K2K57_02265 [Oscillospiraceae bacterium]|nr:hypothetical protein [Oscillospiraceae bacterium]
MTGLDLFGAVGAVDEELLEESEHIKGRLHWRRVLPFAASAACIALIAAVAVNLREEDIVSRTSETILETRMEVPETGSICMQDMPGLPEYTANTLTEIIIGDETCEVRCSITTAGVDSVIFPALLGTENMTEAAVTVPPILTEEGYIPPPGGYTGVEDFTETTSVPHEVTTVHDLDTTVDLTGLPLMEDMLIPHWEDMSDMERFTRLSWHDSEYSITTEKFDRSELAFSPNKGELLGYDVYTDREFSMPIGVYSISGINENYMVAVITADGKYTGFRNYIYTPDSLDGFLSDTDFYGRKMPQKLYSGDVVSASEHMEYTLPDLPERVEHMLTMRKYTAPEINPPMDMGLSVYALMDGNGDYVMTIYENGYINILGKIFKVGEDVTGEFAEYVEENAVKSGLVTYGITDGFIEMIPE